MKLGSVTIIIPCYKAAATLRRAVGSALHGAPADTQLLLVDDGSPAVCTVQRGNAGVLCG